MDAVDRSRRFQGAHFARTERRTMHHGRGYAGEDEALGQSEVPGDTGGSWRKGAIYMVAEPDRSEYGGNLEVIGTGHARAQ